MKFKPLFTDNENYYSIGIDQETNEYLMEVVITWVGLYSIFFRLSNDEIDQFKKDNNSLIDLAERFAQDKGKKFYKDRLVYSEMED